MSWSKGYFAEEGYTYGVYNDANPVRQALTALLAGHAGPSLQTPFSFLDLGCGQGLQLCLLAACYPDSHFLGVDFMPSHIAHGRDLAVAAGLTNAVFEEGDFESLAAAPPSHWPQFSMAMAHGIFTWIAPALRRQLVQLTGHVLAPGGTIFLSHNTLPGWLSRMPFQHMAQRLAASGTPGPQALEATRALFGQLEQARAHLFQVHPSLPEILQVVAGQDPTYLAQEYLNQNWEPLYIDQVMALLAESKLAWLGSTTMAGHLDDLLSPPFQELLKAQQEPAQRELVRDLLFNESFRRDVYAKGHVPLWSGEQEHRLSNLPVMVSANPDALRRPGFYTLKNGSGQAQLPQDKLEPILRPACEQPIALGELSGRDPALRRPLLLLLLAERLAIATNHAVNCEPAQRLNRQIAAAIAQGAPYGHLALPRLGISAPIPPKAKGGLERILPLVQRFGGWD